MDKCPQLHVLASAGGGEEGSGEIDGGVPSRSGVGGCTFASITSNSK